jgi:tetratricopeptide (TPR) repeat protein
LFNEAIAHFSAAMKSAIGNGAIVAVDDLYEQARKSCQAMGEEGRGQQALFLLHAFDAIQQLGKQEWYRQDIEEAARFFAEQGDHVRTALATGHMAITDWTGGRNRKSLETARVAQELAYKTGHEPLMIYGDFALGNIEFLGGEPRKGIERLKALVARLGGVKKTATFGDMISVPGIMARTFASWYLYDMGEEELARKYCDEGKELASIVNQNYSNVLAGLAEAYLLYRAKDYPAASSVLEQVLQNCAQHAIYGLETIASARYLCSLVKEGRLDEADLVLQRHNTEGHLASVQHSCAYYRWEGEARLLAARGQYSKAIAVMGKALAESLRQNDPLHAAHSRLVAAEIRLASGDCSAAALAELSDIKSDADKAGFVPLARECEQLLIGAKERMIESAEFGS